MPADRNRAAWQPRTGTPLEVGPADDWTPGAGEIVIRNAAVAINPVDHILQDQAIFDRITYPAILGSDVAGEVVAVGEGVTRFKPGDRVLGQGVMMATNRPCEGAFQLLTVVRENMAALIPDGMSFTDAAVLPLGLGTAACGLFEADQLALVYPSLHPEPAGQAVLVWGGSSSVGCNGIQLAIAAGYEVLATASPRNFDLLRRLGASEVFDYHDDGAIGAIVAALSGKTIAGALHCAGAGLGAYEVVSRAAGRRFVATTQAVPDAVPEGVEARRIFGGALKDTPVGEAVYGAYLGPALAAGRHVAAPPAHVVGRGLEALQAGLEALKGGVSAEKVVIRLD